eukprot:jgi/Botrbrau1/8578/Bobra.0380s0001.1
MQRRLYHRVDLQDLSASVAAQAVGLAQFDSHLFEQKTKEGPSATVAGPFDPASRQKIVQLIDNTHKTVSPRTNEQYVEYRDHVAAPTSEQLVGYRDHDAPSDPATLSIIDKLSGEIQPTEPVAGVSKPNQIIRRTSPPPPVPPKAPPPRRPHHRPGPHLPRGILHRPALGPSPLPRDRPHPVLQSHQARSLLRRQCFLSSVRRPPPPPRKPPPPRPPPPLSPSPPPPPPSSVQTCQPEPPTGQTNCAVNCHC